MNIRPLQERLIKMIVVFDRFCRKHKLEYWLSQGELVVLSLEPPRFIYGECQIRQENSQARLCCSAIMMYIPQTLLSKSHIYLNLDSHIHSVLTFRTSMRH